MQLLSVELYLSRFKYIRSEYQLKSESKHQVNLLLTRLRLLHKSILASIDNAERVIKADKSFRKTQNKGVLAITERCNTNLARVAQLVHDYELFITKRQLVTKPVSPSV